MYQIYNTLAIALQTNRQLQKCRIVMKLRPEKSIENYSK